MDRVDCKSQMGKPHMALFALRTGTLLQGSFFQGILLYSGVKRVTPNAPFSAALNTDYNAH